MDNNNYQPAQPQYQPPVQQQYQAPYDEQMQYQQPVQPQYQQSAQSQYQPAPYDVQPQQTPVDPLAFLNSDETDGGNQ